MCKYCDIIKEPGTMIVLGGRDYISISMENFAGWSHYLCAAGDDDIRVEIQYCPFCGKKLQNIYRGE